ncbi:bifunctional ADP-dependent NAD(P)H-hydrate dehydratase/NAD(P)H-hydrate epimerase [Nonlabens marinus]|uniref:Bifunctional NAD(P)H-hydrate repair enzyme n=1 Tax=Nonlabens marinus S1-08 TaxID=1454201 RepID=W8VS68_9FLAO|nr:bifunctional ADP-dependent NAD(P)H-hydrate dehydratase/NAD(P)H-hydrate epimerase [Nonlabens marinus]BAO56679.1 NAD(P)HX epimerase / NAD(P)HX dehydratase [Nonlabens marinus S1-08]
MKLLTAQQLAEADKVTLLKQNISSEELMERVSMLVFNKIHERLGGAPVPIKIFCGIGNNGGDGLAIARHMIQHGYQVKVYITNCSKHRSEDFLTHYDKIKNVTKDWPTLLDCKDDIPVINGGDIVIDAIFGIGLNRPIDGWMADLIKQINESKAFIVSIDMPSGLYADTAQPADSAVVRASHTFTFNNPKLSFFLPDTGVFAGSFEVIDIGLDPEFVNNTEPIATLITNQAAQAIYKPRTKFSHKGDYGHTLVMAGSKGKIGAAVLSASAAINTGSGKVTAYVPSCGNNILQTSVPEVMTLTDAGSEHFEGFDVELDNYNLCVGPGIGTGDAVVSAFAKAIKQQSAPVVIDADGINILSANKKLIKDVPESSVLTPHDGELERLLGKWSSGMERLELAKTFSSKHNLILVLKGAHTITVSGTNMYINDSGNAGMATAGSGDVLSGVISSLISQKYEPLMAAVFGVYIHGAAGDLAAQTYAHEGLKAGIISNFVGPAILQLFRNDTAQRA